MRFSQLLFFAAALCLMTVRPVHPEDTMSGPVYIVTYFDVAPTAAQQSLTIARQFAEASRKEDGNAGFEVFEEIGRPSRFAILEVWRDKKASDAHNAGVAATEFRDKLPPLNSGEFVANEKDWTFLLNKAMFTDPSPDSIDQQGEGSPGLAQTVYHEGRHAEQWFRMARLKAGSKWKAKVIADWLSIPVPIAKEAVRHPLKGDGPEAREAEAWIASISGGAGEKNAKAEQGADEPQRKLLAAKAALEASIKAFGSYLLESITSV